MDEIIRRLEQQLREIDAQAIVLDDIIADIDAQISDAHHRADLFNDALLPQHATGNPNARLADMLQAEQDDINELMDERTTLCGWLDAVSADRAQVADAINALAVAR